MFDFGFTELMLVAVVALIVVGPHRLPKVARTGGHLLGRLQRYVSDVKSDISREMQLEDLKKLQQEVKEQARDLESSVRKQMNKVEAEVGDTTAELNRQVALDAKPGAAADDAATPRAPVSDVRPPVADAASGTPEDDGAAAEEQLELGLDSERRAQQRDEKP